MAPKQAPKLVMRCVRRWNFHQRRSRGIPRHDTIDKQSPNARAFQTYGPIDSNCHRSNATYPAIFNAPSLLLAYYYLKPKLEEEKNRRDALEKGPKSRSTTGTQQNTGNGKERERNR